MLSTSYSFSVMTLLFALSVLTGCAGSSGEPVALESTPASALRQQFPGRAALVLEQRKILVATGEGFALEKSPAPGAFRGVEVALPREGGEAIRFHGLGGADVAVREVGARGEGVVAERAVAYRRAGGTSFWMAAKEGVEEWLHLEASAVRAGESVAAWEIEGATVRQRGEGVELIDGSGMVRLAVTAPKAYAVGGGEIEARLVGIGARIELHVDASGEAVLVDPLWVPVGSMAQARGWHTATLLGSGKVLVVGGYDSNTKSNPASAELYDPATSAWTPAASMSQGRGYHTATLLADGTVLVAGGCCAPGDLASAERYDPPTNTWSAAGAMSQVRRVHVAARLVNGKVLVAGGYDEVNCLSTAELYDPATNTWSPTAPMSQARDFFAATSLPDGKVLVAGGFQAGFDVAVAPSPGPDPVP